MLKAYAIENLRAGMIIGRDVLDESTNVLIGAGTVLNNDMIFSLLDRPIFSVYVEEAEPVIEATFVPGQEFLLDDAYMTCYERVHIISSRSYSQRWLSGARSMLQHCRN